MTSGDAVAEEEDDDAVNEAEGRAIIDRAAASAAEAQVCPCPLEFLSYSTCMM